MWESVEKVRVHTSEIFAHYFNFVQNVCAVGMWFMQGVSAECALFGHNKMRVGTALATKKLTLLIN